MRLRTIYIVMTKNRYVLGVYNSKGDALGVVKDYEKDSEGIHIVESILYPESWRGGDP